VQDGAAPSYGSAVTSGQCKIRSWSNDGQIAVVDNSALCDLEELNVMVGKSGTITVEYWVPTSGALFTDDDLGIYIQFTVSETSAVVTPKVFDGMVRRVGHTAQVRQLQVQTVEILKYPA